jgi:hypothetical protein
LLCYIAHSGDLIADFDTAHFYMSHVWAVGIVELVKRLVFWPAMLVVCMTAGTTKSKVS